MEGGESHIAIESALRALKAAMLEMEMVDLIVSAFKSDGNNAFKTASVAVWPDRLYVGCWVHILRYYRSKVCCHQSMAPTAPHDIVNSTFSPRLGADCHSP